MARGSIPAVLISLLIITKSSKPPSSGRDLNWNTLFGSISYQTEQGSVANQHLLEPGLLREANGGYLILQLDEATSISPISGFKLQNAMQKARLDWNAALSGKGKT